MRKLVLLALCVASATAVSQTLVPELAATGMRGDVARAEKKKAEARFDALDANKDGKLSRDEVTGQSAYLADNFEKLDTDKDGYLSWEEFIGHNRWPK